MMQCLLAPSHVYCHPVSGSSSPSLPHTPSTVRAFDGVCLPFLLHSGEAQWRVPIRRACSKPWVDHFSQVSDYQRDLSGYTLKRYATPQSVNTPLQRREWHLRTLEGDKRPVTWESLSDNWVGAQACSKIKNSTPHSCMDLRKRWRETEEH